MPLSPVNSVSFRKDSELFPRNWLLRGNKRQLQRIIYCWERKYPTKTSSLNEDHPSQAWESDPVGVYGVLACICWIRFGQSWSTVGGLKQVARNYKLGWQTRTTTPPSTPGALVVWGWWTVDPRPGAATCECFPQSIISRLRWVSKKSTRKLSSRRPGVLQGTWLDSSCSQQKVTGKLPGRSHRRIIKGDRGATLQRHLLVADLQNATDPHGGELR